MWELRRGAQAEAERCAVRGARAVCEPSAVVARHEEHCGTFILHSGMCLLFSRGRLSFVRFEEEKGVIKWGIIVIVIVI